MADTRWMIYGANGYTGRLVAARAVERGERPVLAGRDAATVAELADRLGLPWRCFPLTDPGSVRAHLVDLDAVLHCAGPFVHTSRPMVDACLDTATHYLDITGEIPVFEAVLARGEQARRAGVALLPGVGFDVVPTDCLAARLAESLPGAERLELAFYSARGGFSRGTLKTIIEALPRGAAERRDGRIVPLPPAAAVETIPFSCGRRTAMTIAWGDVSTAFHTTGIPNVRVYAAAPPAAIRRLRRLRWLLPLAGTPPVKRLLAAWVDRRVTGPDAEARERGRTHLWGRAATAEGDAVSATLDVPEGYTFTAISAVEAMSRVLAGAVEPGAWTPARAFGAGFVTELPGVEQGEIVRSFAAADEAAGGD